MSRWTVAIGCSIGLAVGFGPVFVLSFGLFQKAMVADLGWSRSDISLGFSLATLVAAITNTAVGAWIDRVGVKIVTLTGVVLFSALLAALATVMTPAQYLGVAAAIGVAGAMTSYPAYLPALPPFFQRNLGLAFAISAAGVGGGTMIVSLAAAQLIAATGWRAALVALAGAVLLIGTVNVLTLIPRSHLTPRVADDPDAAPSRAGLRFGQAVRTRSFWMLAISFGLVAVVGIGINFHMGALLTDRGMTPLQAAGVVSVTGLAITIARLCVGVLLDVMPMRMIGLLLFCGQALGVLLLWSGAGGAVPYVAAMLLGAAIGGEGDLMPYALSRRFGGASYGTIYGFAFGFYNLGTLAGPLALAWGFDASGSYSSVLIGLAGLSLVAAALFYGTGAVGNSAPTARESPQLL